jgi:hypothetical protein
MGRRDGEMPTAFAILVRADVVIGSIVQHPFSSEKWLLGGCFVDGDCSAARCRGVRTGNSYFHTTRPDE